MIGNNFNSTSPFFNIFTVLISLVCSTFLVFSCVWLRKVYKNFFPSRSFRNLEEAEEVYFNEISIATVPQVNIQQSLSKSHTPTLSYEHNLPYNEPVIIEALPKFVSLNGTKSKNDFSRLRPKIAKVGFEISDEDFDNQVEIIKKTSGESFPRSQLQYIKELGIGRFGKVLEGEATHIQPGHRRTHVVVVMADSNAPHECQAMLLFDALPYRELRHSNIMKFYSLCTDSPPYLAVYEAFKIGDVKTFLRSHRTEMQSMLNKGVIMAMMCDIVAGLQALHQMNYVHRDLALRNCMLTGDMVVKIGDHGLAEVLYKDDYYYNTSDAEAGIPIRWMAPESLDHSYVLSVLPCTKEANIWTTGVVIWETLSCGGVPYPHLSNEHVLKLVVKEKQVKPQRPLVVVDHVKYLYELMSMCWCYEVEDRPTIREVKMLLLHLSSSKSYTSDVFDQKWNQLKPLVHKNRDVRDEEGNNTENTSENNSNNNNNNNINNNNNNDDDSSTGSDVYDTDYKNLSRENFKESTNNLSLAEELKFHVVHTNNNNNNNNNNNKYTNNNDDKNNNNSKTSNNNKNNNNDDNISYDNDDDFDLININNSSDINTNNNNNIGFDTVSNNNNNNSDDDLSYERVFKDDLILKRDRYNHYLNTVTTSIDEYDKKKNFFDDSE